MSQNNGRAKRSEKGLLTPDNCVVAFIDHQPQMLFGTSNFDRQSIINSTVALAKAARVFDVPVVLTTVESKSFSGNMWPQLKAIFPGQEPIDRSFMNSWDDKKFVAAIEKTGRKEIVLSGLWTETCVALPPSRQFMMATKSMWPRIAAETSASWRTTTQCAGWYRPGRSRSPRFRPCSSGSATGRIGTPTMPSWIW